MLTWLVRISVYIFAAWFVWVSWRAVPHFSEGIEAGAAYYRSEASDILGEFARAGQRIREYAMSRMEAMDFWEDPPDGNKPKGKFRTLDE